MGIFINLKILNMKFATLALFAVVSATTTPAATVKEVDVTVATTTCPAPSANEAKAYKAVTGLKATKDAAVKVLEGVQSVAETLAKKDLKTLDKCYTTNDATTDTLKATSHAVGGKCESDWNSWADAENDVYTAKCHVASQKAATGGSAGVTIGIIIGVVVVCCCIGGGLYYVCVHKKKQGAEGMYNDDLYEAFVDQETA